MWKVNIWPTLEAASRQTAAVAGEIVGPIVSWSVGDDCKPIIGLNELEMVKKIEGEVGSLIGSNRLIFRFVCPYGFIYIWIAGSK